MVDKEFRKKIEGLLKCYENLKLQTNIYKNNIESTGSLLSNKELDEIIKNINLRERIVETIDLVINNPAFIDYNERLLIKLYYFKKLSWNDICNLYNTHKKGHELSVESLKYHKRLIIKTIADKLQLSTDIQNCNLKDFQ
jgi:hypothetical protein